MNALAPPKQKRRRCETALRTDQLSKAHSALTVLQAPFSFVFWLIERRKATLQDRIDNERSL
jgi:hypothetical protein